MAVTDPEAVAMATQAFRDPSSQSGAAEPPPNAKVILREIWTIALPNIAGYLMQLINEFTNTIVLGHSGGGSVALAAVGLANMMQNCIGLSVGFGICAALDTLVSQAYGARQHVLTSHHLQRCRIIVTLQLVWMIPVLWYSEEWLTLIHQDPATAKAAGQYNRASVWGLFATFQYEAGRKFLQNRNDANPGAIIGVITACLHPLWALLFVIHCDLGNAGAGYANTLTWWLQFLLSAVYLCYYSKKHGFSRKSILWIERPGFREWGAYLKLALPATLALCTEWWFWEICAFVVGLLDVVSLAAHTATINFVAISFMPVIGIQASTATLVGNALGANLPRKARKTSLICVVVNVGMWCIMAACMFFGRGLLASVYTSDPETQEVMKRLLSIFAFAGFFDSTQNVMGGALRGAGYQMTTAIVYIIAFYGFMLPGGIALAFPLKNGVEGIWYSFVVGTGIALLVFSVVLFRVVNFRKLAADAASNMARAGDRAAKDQAQALVSAS